MRYALVHYPVIDASAINRLRKKYDPQADLIEPHITVIFPLPEAVDERGLVSHIENVLLEWKPFAIHLKGLERSADNYLFLTIQEGRLDVVRLHDELYTGVLAQHLKQELPFVPHITLGAFDSDERLYLKAFEQAEGMKLDFWSVVDRLDLLKIDSDRNEITLSKTFRL